MYIITIYTQILIFDCPRRSMLIRQKCQKVLRVSALYFAAYGLAAEILDYVYTTPERNNAGRIYERLHYTVVVF